MSESRAKTAREVALMRIAFARGYEIAELRAYEPRDRAVLDFRMTLAEMEYRDEKDGAT